MKKMLEWELTKNFVQNWDKAIPSIVEIRNTFLSKIILSIALNKLKLP